jgi:hypothetical protein
MRTKKLSQDGFHVIELTLVVLVLAIVGFVGFKVLGNKKTPKTNQTTATTQTPTSHSKEPVKWAFNQDALKWFTQTGTAPKCRDPFVFDQSPVDLSKMMVIGMPGAYRGYNYKPHGGMRLSDANSGNVDIKMPIDATLTGITRYYEGNPAELQYLLSFETDCGIAFRFDHIYTLTPAFQAIAEKTPAPKVNDTGGDPNIPFSRTVFKTGDLVATAVGFPRVKNFGFDFGVYDYRSRNEISKNTKWASIHNTYQAFEWFGACWMDMLPGADKAKAKELAFVVVNPARPNIISDYCSYAPHTTLDFSDGQPTDG